MERDDSGTLRPGDLGFGPSVASHPLCELSKSLVFSLQCLYRKNEELELDNL